MTEPLSKPLDPEVVEHEDTALASVAGGGPALAPLAFNKDAVQIIERMGQTLQALQAALIRCTQPEHWIMQGSGFGLLSNAGCNACAPLLGLQINPLEGGDLTPVKTEREGGVVEYSIRAVAFSKLLNREEEIEVTRSSIEPFLGRQTDGAQIVRKGGAVHDPDQRSATRSLLLSKAVRKLGGLGNVPEARLLEVFGTAAAKRFQRGHGAGSGQDRAAEGASQGGGQQRAQAIWDRFLRLHAGDVAAAQADLKKRTSYPAKAGSYDAFDGVNNLKQLATRNERAFKILESYLDKAEEQAAPREEAQDGRQPGED